MNKEDIVPTFSFYDFVKFVESSFPHFIIAAVDSFRDGFPSSYEILKGNSLRLHEEALRALDFRNPRVFEVVNDAYKLEQSVRIGLDSSNPVKFY